MSTSTTSVFISGPITGDDIQKNTQAMRHAISMYEVGGYSVYHTLDLPKDRDEVFYMLASSKLICDVDLVLFLDNWCQSKGAIAEFFLAQKLGKRVKFQSPFELSKLLTAIEANTQHLEDDAWDVF